MSKEVLAIGKNAIKAYIQTMEATALGILGHERFDYLECGKENIKPFKDLWVKALNRHNDS